MKSIHVFSPATIANISCGFDALGCCLNDIGDDMWVNISPQKGIHINRITGVDLPLEAKKNVVGAAGYALLDALDKPLDFGFEIEIKKNIKPGSGIGSSAASAAGIVYALNELLDKPFNKKQLIEFARAGEQLACGSPIADNVAPALLGGFTLVQTDDPLNILELPSIKGIYATVIHPQIEIKTSDSRAILPQDVPLKLAVKQWANVGGLVHALHSNDSQLLSKCLVDYLVEPHRAKLIPHFNEVQSTAIKACALGCGISGSGPSIFAFSSDLEKAQQVAESMDNIYRSTGISYHIYNSTINPTGVKIIDSK